MPTKIEWTDETWNPVTGCMKVSEGCANCYAERIAKRLAGRAGYPKDNPFAVTLHEDRLEQPKRWRKKRRVFVCSMGDLFHSDVPGHFINAVFRAMVDPMFGSPRHTYIILTKRPERLLEAKLDYFQEYDNIWLGVSVENQARADERIPILLDIPAAVRFVSIEPMLGSVDLTHDLDGFTSNGYTDRKLDWIIVGGESGPGARPMHPDWARSVRDQCIAAGVPFFFKQWGVWGEIAAVRYVENDERYTTMGKYAMKRYGKKYSGRLLDGREWNEWPEVK